MPKKGSLIGHLIWILPAIVFQTIIIGLAKADPARPDFVPLPCQENASSTSCLGLDTCSNILKRADQTGIQDVVGNLVQQKIEYFYKGLDVDTFATTDPNNPLGAPFQKPVCNPVEGEITAQIPPRPTGNCGNYILFESNGSVDAIAPNGTREVAYKEGAFLQAIKCFRNQVFNEMTQNKGVNAGMCLAMAQDVASTTQALQSAMSGLSALCASAEKDFMKVCSGQTATSGIQFAGTSGTQFLATQFTNTKLSSPDMKHMEAVCYLQTARLNLEAAYSYTAYCEILQRAASSFAVHAHDIDNDITNLVINPCKDYANNGQCDRHVVLFPGLEIGGVTIIPRIEITYTSPSCVINAFYDCYRGLRGGKGLPGLMPEIIQKYYPDNGNCQSKREDNREEGFPPIAASVFFVGSWASRWRRTRLASLIRNKKGQIMALPLLSIAVAAVVVFFIVCGICNAFNLSCGAVSDISFCSAPSATINANCSANGISIADKTMAAACCDPNDSSQPLGFSSGGCQPPGHTELPKIAQIVLQGVAAANSAIQNANQLIGGDIPIVDKFSTGAATAGKFTPSSPDQGPFRGGSPISPPKNQGGGGLGIAGDSGTIDAGDTAPAENETTSSGSAIISSNLAYATAGGKGAAAGNKKKLLLKNSLGLSATGSAGLNVGPTGPEVNPRGSDDPEDYFTRIGLDESLFVIVHRRYQTEHTGWINEAYSKIKAILPPTKPVPKPKNSSVSTPSQ